MNSFILSRLLMTGVCLVWTDMLPAFTAFPFKHQEITQDGLSSANFIYVLPNGTSVAFDESRVSDISGANAEVDLVSMWDEEMAETYHFDTEQFGIGQSILRGARNQVVLQLKDPAFRRSGPTDLLRQQELTTSSYRLIGRALHTLQDYYSHSNWVEKGIATNNLVINPSLGVTVVLHDATTASCNEAAPALGPMTTGDYRASGVFDCARICEARPNKCAHGNVFFSEASWIARCPEIPPNIECGINKDHAGRPNHLQAKALATDHTTDFVRSLFNEALAGSGLDRQGAAIAICQLMGIPDAQYSCTTKHTLQVQKQDAGGSPLTVGMVRSDPAGIDCGATCSAQFIEGTPVTLRASDAPPWIFVRWGAGGACAGSSNRACTVEVSSDQTARAVYSQIAPQPLTLSTWARSCWLQTYQNNYSCPAGSLPDFHDELRVDYGGGEIAYITADGAIVQPPGVPGLQSTIEASAVGQWFARGGQRIAATYFKNILITSNTLPPQTPVTVKATFTVELAHNLDVTLNEPPYIQWSAQLPYLSASVQVAGSTQDLSLGTNGGGPTGPVAQTLNRSIDVTFVGVVGGSFEARIDLLADMATIQAARAYVRQHRSARVNGPYLIEVNGLDVQFVGN